MSATLPFVTLKPWLERRFGMALHRVALDAGSTCPNRDGTKGRGGCVYCDVEGSGTGALRSGVDLAAQMQAGLERIRRRARGPLGAIAYFQSYSNTYVAPERLDEVLATVEPFLRSRGGPVRVVALATRPDTLPDWALERLARLAREVEVWVELGLEAADDQVLERIQRLHTVAEFHGAAARARAAGLDVIGHAILGLPGDGREGAARTAQALREAHCTGVKVHHLMVLERTILAAQWRRGEVELLDPTTYVEWLADFVEQLGPTQVLHRLTGDAPPEHQLAPRWSVHKSEIRRMLAEELSRRGTFQGAKCAEPTGPRAADPA